MREEIADPESKVELLAPLGFGHANVVVAVPQAWIDVRAMADLADVADGFRARHGRGMRVATKYVNTTRRFFAEHGVSDYRIVESSGATEGAPAAGSADLIVDITTTGATLAANALKVLDDGVILRSQANLVASLTAPWSETAREAARVILSRIAAEEAARTTREVRATLAARRDDSRRGACGLRRDAARAPRRQRLFRLSDKTGRRARGLADWKRRAERDELKARLRLPRRQCVVGEAVGTVATVRPAPAARYCAV